MRQEFNLLEYDKESFLPTLQADIDKLGLGLEFYVDEYLLFWEQHFHDLGFTVYPNGYEKGGTLRYKENIIRVPSNVNLAVYESQEFKQGKNPRGIVQIPKLTICTLDDLTELELLNDDYTSQNEVLPDMKEYYKDIKNSSIVTFYYFGNYFQNIYDFEPKRLESWQNELKRLGQNKFP